ncbi:MAG: DUF58 domain-containing protein [Marinagarivorans sp.]|nr:DUF58 domain-containing protein [Marinagarivorans sp.]
MSFQEQKPKPDYFSKKPNGASPLWVLPEHWQALLNTLFSLRNCLLFLMVALAFIAWNRGLALMYGVVAMLFSLLWLSALLPWLFVRRVRVLQFNAAPVHAHQEQTMAVILNAKKNVRYLQVNLPHTATQFILAFLDKNKKTLHATYTPQQRGHWLLSECWVACAYPLGIVNAKKLSVIAQPGFLTVYPRLLAIKKIPASWLSADTHNDAHPQRQRKGDDLLLGLRDYQMGDAYRTIDWRATARSNELKVREFEHLAQPSFLMVINNSEALNVGDGERNAFEQQMIIAASLACFLIAQGWRVTVAGACNMHLSSAAQLVDFYQQLAELTPLSSNQYQEQHQHKQQYQEQLRDAINESSRASIVISFDVHTAVIDLKPTTIEPNFGEQKHWQFMFNQESYLKPLATYPKSHTQIIANTILIPLLAGDNLAGVFQHD